MTDGIPEDGRDEIGDSSRRTFMRKGVLTSSAVVLGLTASGVTTGTGSYQQPDQAQVFAYDYSPRMPFEVVASLEDTVVEGILGHQIDGGSIVDDPGEYNGYVIYYLHNGHDMGEWAFVFTHNETLQQGEQYQFGPDAMVLVSQANLLETMLSAVDGGEGTTAAGTTTEGTTSTETTVEGTTTAAETSTTEGTTTEGATATEGTATGTATTTEEATTDGTATTEGTTTATSDDEGDGGGQASQAHVFAYDYNSGTPFEVVASLEDTVVEAILGHQIDGEPTIAHPEKYNGYVIVYLQDETGVGEFTITFTRFGTLQEGQRYQFATDAVTFEDRANLLEVSVSSVDGGTTTEEGATTTQEGTTDTGTEEGTDTTTTATDSTTATTTESGTATSEATTTE